MFSKVKNAQMQEPEYGEWGVSRGHRDITRYRAAFVSVDHSITGTKVLAHFLYSAHADEYSFKQFIGKLQLRHGEITQMSIRYQDGATMNMLQTAGITPYVRTRREDLYGDLLVPEKLFRDEIEPFFEVIQVAATTAEDNYLGLSFI